MHLSVENLGRLTNLGFQFPKASARALNKTMLHVRTQAVKAVTEKYRIKGADVKAKMGPTRKATSQSLKAVFRSVGRRISLVYFGATQKRTWPGARVSMYRKEKRTTIAHAFIATMPSGHKGVFLRKAGTSLPILERTGPAVPQMLKGIWDKLQALAGPKLKANLVHEIEWERSRKL
jgi:hypothetical protein